MTRFYFPPYILSKLALIKSLCIVETKIKQNQLIELLHIIKSNVFLIKGMNNTSDRCRDGSIDFFFKMFAIMMMRKDRLLASTVSELSK